MAVRVDDRTSSEVEKTIGFWVATDKFLSGWGMAKGGRSIVACPVVSKEDSDKVERRFQLRKEFIRVRFVSGNKYFPHLRTNDHLHIYTTDAFRYPL